MPILFDHGEHFTGVMAYKPSPAVEDPAVFVAGAGEGRGEGGYDFPLTLVLSPRGEESVVDIF